MNSQKLIFFIYLIMISIIIIIIIILNRGPHLFSKEIAEKFVLAINLTKLILTIDKVNEEKNLIVNISDNQIIN